MKQEGAGGNAIKNSVSIDGEDASQLAKLIIEDINKHLGIRACTLGSTGKKPKGQLSGDIDIALDLEYTEENVNKVYEYLKMHYGNDVEIVHIKGLKIISWGCSYKHTQGIYVEDLIVQVDFMFSTNIEYASFMYHSPNFINNESKFKGLFRTNLMIICASKAPIDLIKYPTTYYEDNEIKDFWKYSWTYNQGLNIVHKTYEGKKKRLKNPKKIEEDTINITTNIEEIIHTIFGPLCTKEDLNSYESLIKYLCSDKYIYKSEEQLNLIFSDFFEDPRHIDSEELTENLKNEIRQYGIRI